MVRRRGPPNRTTGNRCLPGSRGPWRGSSPGGATGPAALPRFHRKGRSHAIRVVSQARASVQARQGHVRAPWRAGGGSRGTRCPHREQGTAGSGGDEVVASEEPVTAARVGVSAQDTTTPRRRRWSGCRVELDAPQTLRPDHERSLRRPRRCRDPIRPGRRRGQRHIQVGNFGGRSQCASSILRSPRSPRSRCWS